MGTLEEMGHPSEATERPSDPFERDIPADRSTVNPSLLVKYYKRGKQLDPRFIRTKQALRKTQDHLRKLLDTSGAPLVQLYPFIDDRNKALQGDYAIQHMQNLDVMFWIAEHVRRSCSFSLKHPPPPPPARAQAPPMPMPHRQWQPHPLACSAPCAC